jgi:hypothetical protein
MLGSEKKSFKKGYLPHDTQPHRQRWVSLCLPSVPMCKFRKENELEKFDAA